MYIYDKIHIYVYEYIFLHDDLEEFCIIGAINRGRHADEGRLFSYPGIVSHEQEAPRRPSLSLPELIIPLLLHVVSSPRTTSCP